MPDSSRPLGAATLQFCTGRSMSSFVGLSLILTAQFSTIHVRAKEGPGTLQTHGSNIFSCSPHNGDPDSAEAAVTLSPESPMMSLECSDGGEFMPRYGTLSTLLDVCKSSATNKKECETSRAALTDFVPKAERQWYSTIQILNEQKKPNGYKYTFQVPDEGFPPVRTQYKFGCQYETGEYCMLTATVEPASTRAGSQTATCVYLEDGPANFQLNMTQSHNAITVACGKLSVPLPEKHHFEYCSGNSVEPERCVPKPMTDILPRYRPVYWTGTKQSVEGAVFEIPEEDFPSKPVSFRIGCSRYDGAGPYCNIKVNVAAAATTTERTTLEAPRGQVTPPRGGGSVTCSGTFSLGLVVLGVLLAV
ncbi:SAG-related sequence [Besnoitia besnoiti]|uniref:SAG-related sequence n=1 Tax=Besnoitia besnoiti TaxID=94643 RepID=A0A2A9MME6_BESBE|nr:SAG-related sequence [Besnoitia besnoiti]PFH37591.1 SAG-related sequence [Besnoitia besnoiti]